MWTAIILICAIGILVAYAATKPDDFRISRSATINAPPEKIFPLINDLHEFNTWNPFVKSDPSVELTFSGPENGPGAKNAWDSKGKAGKGTLEITASSAPSQVNMFLHLLKPMEGRNDIVFALQPANNGTSVSWTMTGKHSLVGKVFSTLMSMEKMVGGPFEQGLADLKAIAEK